MCIYIHPCLFLRKQREVTGVVHIGVGFLRCSFSVVGIAKALNMERTKVRFPRLNRNCDYKYLNYRVYNLTYHINDTKIFPLKTYVYYNFIHCKQFGIPLYFK